jgi:hypothetical protein
MPEPKTFAGGRRCQHERRLNRRVRQGSFRFLYRRRTARQVLVRTIQEGSMDQNRLVFVVLAAFVSATAVSTARGAEASLATRFVATTNGGALGVPPRHRAISPASRADAVSINPQPLPPRISRVRRFDPVAINPQPLPPRISRITRFDSVTINPQPLPPREGGL